ncbi:Protein APA1 [Candida viswanathii]|uniref:Protein APA1 n=1 Tax=Candida viswanathii TaxID=5486 RepID=A0A367YPP6_9ASCO|nr:Protein APA1 [Candida viswanathii]
MSSSGYSLPNDFYQSLSSKYDSAVKGEHVLFNGDSAVNEIEKATVGDTTVDVQLTLLKSLMHRPESGNKDENPFAKPEPELTVVDSYGADEEFKIVFNKFPVVPKHFMLLTKEFKSQDTPLSPNELFATYNILAALDKQKSESNEEWFAFYNCGPESGASQPHKHIQFMTLPPRSEFKPYAETLDKILDPRGVQVPAQNKDLPFAHFAVQIPDTVEDESVLAELYVNILQRTLTELRENDQTHISYNFIMTRKYMLMVPRSKGKYDEKMGINSCGFQGLLLCKNDELFEMVKSVGPLQILGEVGLPNTAGKKSTEYDY